jgi:tRNA (guanine-N(7)-)-methyltransferase subunit TRM82
MKQLLHAHGAYFAVGCNDRAYVVCGVTNQVSELRPSPPPPQKEQATTTTTTTTTEKSDSEEKKKGADTVGSASDNKPQGKETSEVQAVAVTQDETDSTVWCAVSRSDKTLAIYKLELASENNDNASFKNAEIEASIVYNTTKRVGCLCFGSIPAAANDDVSKNSTIIVVGGDLAGDTYAYSLQEKCSRVMLGHTASMLTGVCVSKNHILTCDRDEKVRVSQFPESTIIEGFLLGHEAYVTSIDTAADDAGTSIVASCGGDGTVRLWNVETLQQLDVVDVNKTDEAKEGGIASILIPTDLAFDQEGKTIAVIYDISNRVDLFDVKVDDAKKTTLSFNQSLECPAHTLGVAFHEESLMILLRDPEYITTFQVKPSNSLATIQAVKTLREVVSKESIVTSDTILEKDPYGQPKLKKISETRGPSGPDVPWNRVERIPVAQERARRAKKRRQEENRK